MRQKFEGIASSCRSKNVTTMSWIGLALVPCFFHITAEEFHHVAPICVCVCAKTCFYCKYYFQRLLIINVYSFQT